MSVFYNNNITNKGRQLFALMQDGGKFMPTRIVMGSGYMPQGTTARTINDVVIPFATLEINKSSPKENGDFMLGGLFTNSDLTQDEYFRELGLYAKVQKSDGGMTEEMLYSYGNAFDNAELIPKYGVDTAIERQLDIITYVGNDANVVVEVSSGISVDKQEFTAAIGDLQSQIDALKARNLTGTATAAGWTGSDEVGWTQTVTVAGINADMSPIIDLVPSAKTDVDEWGKIWKAETAADSVKFTAALKPASVLNFKIKVV